MQTMGWCTVGQSKKQRPLKAELQARLAACHLEMHPTKTKVVYCKDGKRKGKHPNFKFDFLGYCFRPRLVRRFRDNSLFGGFNPPVSPSAMKAMRQAIRDLNIRCQTHLSLQNIAQKLNPLLRGWIAYYGRYGTFPYHLPFQVHLALAHRSAPQKTDDIV
jgi:hypothetical protein